MSEVPKRIALKVCGRHEEVTAGSAVLPGCAINMAADGKWDECSVTAAEYLKSAFAMAIEDGLQGKSILDAYADTDPMQIIFPLPGDIVYALVKDGETIVVGDKLIPETVSGLFVEAAGTEARYLLMALEAKTPSGNDFIRCRVLS